MSPIGYGRVRAPMWATRAARAFFPFSWEVCTCAAQPVVFIFQDGDTLSSPTPHTMSGWA